MSTKTSIKRIALVAVAALGFGVVAAVAPANAAHTSATLLAGTTVSSGSGTAAATQVVGGIATVVLTETATAGAAGDILGSITSSGVGSIGNAAQSTNVTVAALGGGTASYPATSLSVTARTTSAANGEAVTFTVTSAVAGVQTLSFTPIASNGAPGTAITMTITWGAASVVSVGYTAAASFIGDGNARPSSVGVPALAYPKTAGVSLASGATTGATIAINVKDNNNANLNGVALTATIEGPGLIRLDSGNSTGNTGNVRAASLTAATQASTNQATLGISADGTAGKATITVSTGTTVLFTKTVIFYGTVATLTAKQNLSILKASTVSGGTLGLSAANPAGTSVATTPAVTIVAKDSNGNVVPGLTITAKPADTLFIASGTVTESDGTGLGDGYAGAGYYNASVTSAVGVASGASSTVVFRTLLADGVTYVSTAPVTFTFGGSALTASEVTASFDQSSYAPGDAAVLTVKVLDSKGNPIYDQDLNLFGGIGTVPVWSKSVNGSTPAAANAAFVGGKKDYKFYAPGLDGDFSIAGVVDANTVLGGYAVTAKATVSGSSSAAIDAANEATDAANAATDAANAAAEAADAATAAAQDAQAAVAALATQVSSLIAGIKAQITSLTNLVIKIQKKVRA